MLINTIIEIFRNTLELGLIYAIVVLAVHISSNVISFDDLSTEGSFATGGAVTAVLAKFCNCPSLVTLLLSIIAGSCIGIATGLLCSKLGLNNLISGIVVTTAFFSINLKLAGAHINLKDAPTILDLFANFVPYDCSRLIVLTIIVGLFILLISWLLKTQVGFLLRAIGTNPQILTTLGKNPQLFKIFGLAISNGLTACAGSLLVLHVGFFSITGSIGTLALALAGLIIGKVLCKNPLAGVVIGSILYQAIIVGTIQMQIDPAWNKLITALLIIVLIAIFNKKKKFSSNRGLSWSN